ncbi:MAG: undecaprenyldiphospho-muramoylpentapeptide beta-N-acetylglucosaminyltransferase [Bacteroidales bacterium]|nr:undecaprenyldiphospho-muramoylpentapeptide beta-N-acetylglucosaminyltransferase [Bacteroidales bacterium]
MSNRRSHKIRFLLSAGGTGGHIFPALAVAGALQDMLPGSEILFVGARGKMEMQKVPAAGYPIKGLWISGIERKTSLKNILLPVKFTWSMIHAFLILMRFKPAVVAGFGGYASAATVKAASILGIPTLVQEQNSFPGITNKILAKSAKVICVAFDGMEKYFAKDKIVITGNPVRKSAIDLVGKNEEASDYFKLDRQKTTVLLIGGSQGALSVNKSVAAGFGFFVKNDIQLIWQTGSIFYDQALSLINDDGKNLIRIRKFIDRMDLAYAMADIVISRAGAIALTEIACTAKPSILIPLPTAAEDHQTKNATRLLEKDAAILVPDGRAKEQLYPELEELVRNEQKRYSLSKNIIQFATKDAAKKIAVEILKLSKKVRSEA